MPPGSGYPSVPERGRARTWNNLTSTNHAGLSGACSEHLAFILPGPHSDPEGRDTRATERRSTGMSRSGRWPYVRRLAWDRDRKARAVCHICGQPINYFLQPSSCADAWEPDHVIPVAKDPSLELDLGNIKASHKRCNRSRGDGTNGENIIGMQSRIW